MPIDPRMYDSGWQALMSVGNERVNLQQLSAMAEMGAQQLAAYGPEGQAWATRLRQNPMAALQMAQQFGGLAKIEGQLRLSQAAGKGATLDQLATTALTNPLGTSADLATVYGATTNRMGAETNAATLPIQQQNADTNRMIAETGQAMLPIEAAKVGASNASTSATTTGQAFTLANGLRNSRSGIIDPTIAATQAIIALQNVNPNDPTWDMTMLQLGQNIYGAAASRPGTTEAVREDLSRGWEMLVNRIKRSAEFPTDLGPKERMAIQRQVLQTAKDVVDSAPAIWQAWVQDDQPFLGDAVTISAPPAVLKGAMQASRLAEDKITEISSFSPERTSEEFPFTSTSQGVRSRRIVEEVFPRNGGPTNVPPGPGTAAPGSGVMAPGGETKTIGGVTYYRQNGMWYPVK